MTHWQAVKRILPLFNKNSGYGTYYEEHHPYTWKLSVMLMEPLILMTGGLLQGFVFSLGRILYHGNPKSST